MVHGNYPYSNYVEDFKSLRIQNSFVFVFQYRQSGVWTIYLQIRISF